MNVIEFDPVQIELYAAQSVTGGPDTRPCGDLFSNACDRREHGWGANQRQQAKPQIKSLSQYPYFSEAAKSADDKTENPETNRVHGVTEVTTS